MGLVMAWRAGGGKLSSRKVETAGAGTYDDGGGLRLTVRAGGSRSWTLRYQMAGRRRDMGLGRFPDVSLAKAREKADAARRLIADGIDPLAEKGRRQALSFEKAAEGLLASRASAWRNGKHAAQWRSTLATYAFPQLGGLDVTKIETRDVLGVLEPIWQTVPETASRVRQRIEAVLDYATAMGVRTGDNPARWRGHLDHLLPKPSKVRAVVHHPALDWRKVPAFMTALAAREGMAARALAFTILTAARSGEVRGMCWREIDLEAGVWTVPASRMKAGKEHRVPLEPAALALLGPPGQSDACVFPGGRRGKALSDMALTAVLRRMGHEEITVHGFRSTFRDWAGEASSHPREVIEAALAHRLKDRAEAAYARGDLFVKRRRLMRDWAAFCSHPAGEVLPLLASDEDGLPAGRPSRSAG